MRQPGHVSVGSVKSCFTWWEAPGATYITDYMGVSQIDAKCGCRIDASVHAGYYLALRESVAYEQLVGKGLLPTRYFFAGGRARSPCVKEDA